MDFLNFAKTRYSVRKFSDKPVEKEKIDLILEAGRIAPTAMNYQSQRVLILDTSDSIAKINRCYSYLINPPLALLICYDRTISAKRPSDKQDFGIVDATIATVHMMFEITELGLGTTFVAGFDTKKIKQEFFLPDNIVPIALLPVGYPAEDSVPAPSHHKRVDLTHTVFYNFFPDITE